MRNTDIGVRRRRRPRRLGVVVASGLLSASGCAELVTERAFAPVATPEAGPDATIEFTAPAAVYVLHVRLSGGASFVRWRSGGREVGVHARPHSTTYWSWGPVLPVIPVFGTSRARELEVDAWASGGDNPIRARLPDFVLRVPGRSDSVAPAAARVPATATATLRGAMGDEAVVTGRGVSVRLIYPLDPDEVETADLSVRFAAEDASWEFARTVRFVRAQTTFVMTIP